MHRAGSCPPSPGGRFGSVPRRRGRSFPCIPASILPKPGGGEGGTTDKLSLSTLHGLQVGASAQEKVTTAGHLLAALPGRDFIFSIFQWE